MGWKTKQHAKLQKYFMALPHSFQKNPILLEGRVQTNNNGDCVLCAKDKL